MKKLFFLAAMMMYTQISFSQHHITNSPSEAHQTHGMKGAHRLTLGIGHTHISEGKNAENGKTQWLATASWTFNYDYWISNKWAIGLQNDLILESFIIEHGDQEILERSYPWAIVPTALFKPGKNFTFLIGAGTEMAKGHSIGLTRLGIEYGKHLPKNYELGLALVWDNKWNFYNSWGICLGVSKIWPKKHLTTVHP